MSNAPQVAALLGGLRLAGKRGRFDGGLPLVAAEALLHIYQGVDSITGLQNAMRLSPAQTNRTISLLRGRGRKAGDSWIESQLGLVKVTNHPHHRGYRLQLTDDAKQLLDSTFAPLNMVGEQNL